MSEGDSATSATSRSVKAKESLSQFVARVLDQLSLSAWLPAAALVLSLDFILQLGSSLAANPEESFIHALTAAIDRIAKTSLGGAILLIVSIVVRTMVTQAFAFEAIRIFEGY